MILKVNHNISRTLILLVVIGGLSQFTAVASDLPRYKWRISNLNGYPIFSDINYRYGNFLGSPHWPMDEKLLRTGILTFAIPQLSVSVANPNSNWFYSIESRISPGTNLFFTRGDLPRPIKRDEIAVNLLVGRFFSKNNWEHRLCAGISGRYLATYIIFSVDQDLFSDTPDETITEHGIVLKYECTRLLGSKKAWEVGIGINQTYYASGINVTNLGFVVGHRFNTAKKRYGPTLQATEC